MDIARPDLKAKRKRRRIIALAGALIGLAIAAALARRLDPATPVVDQSTLWTGVVKRGGLIRQVRALGTLTPREDAIRQIPAQTDATVVRILVLPGSQVHPDTALVELADPQLSQAALDAQLALKEAEADLENTNVKLESDLMAQKSSAATVDANFQQAARQAQTDEALYKLGVISGLAAQSSRGDADELSVRNRLEKETVAINEKAVETQMAVQKAKVSQARALADLKQQQLDALTVRAGIAGVLTALPWQAGQRVTAGSMLATIVVPNQLKAELKVPETQARDLQIGQPATVDTHNGVIQGAVSRVDPAVQNGTVTVDIQLNGEMPPGARPDLSVDGTIDLERLHNVLYVGRPAVGDEDSTIDLFRIEPGGAEAVRVPVKTGRASASSLEILQGLQQGDTVILSDMSRWDGVNRIRLN